jgi:hypothetical protein
MRMASGLSGARGMNSNSIMPATPKGSFSRSSCASAAVVQFMMKTTPYASFWKNHWSILPVRWRRTVALLRKVRQRRSRRAFPWPSRYQSPGFWSVGTATAASGGNIATLAPRFICSDIASLLLLVLRESANYFGGPDNSERSGLSAPSGMIWNSINPPWPKGSLARRSWASLGSVRFMMNTTRFGPA